MRRIGFKTVDDILGSAFWTRVQEHRPKENSRIFTSSRLEDMIYRDLRKNVDDGLDEIERLGCEKLETFPSLIQDTFQAIYTIKPKRADECTLTTNARIFNKDIMAHVLACEEYPAFKAICEGRDLPAYEAIKEFAAQIFEKLDELLTAANNANDEDKKLIDLIGKLEEQQEALIEKVTDSMVIYNRGGVSDEKVKQLLRAANSADSKQSQIDNLSDMVAYNIRKSKASIHNVISEVVYAAKEKAELTQSVISSWGLECSNPQTLRHNKELLQRVQSNDKIKRIAKYLGKYREILENARKNSFAYGRGDKFDITLGNDFTRAISSEYGYLAMKETVPIFIRKVQQKRLKQYRKRERVSKGYGDIVICLDESYSTSGNPIAWGKALALTLMEAANRNGRNCVIIRFSGVGEVYPHYFLKDKFTTEDVLTFADSFLGGGTEFTGPLNKAVEVIEDNSFRNSDMLFLTDGECTVSKDFEERFKQKRTELNFSMNAIVLDTDGGMTSTLEGICDRIYRLSDVTRDSIVAELIKMVA